VELVIGPYLLTGRIQGMVQDRLLLYRYARIRAQDHVRAWIHHLVLNHAACNEGAWHSQDGPWPKTTMLAGLEKKGREDRREWKAWTIAAVEGGEGLLSGLLEMYWRGLIMPLPFFPRSSWEYAARRAKGMDPEAALERAGAVWKGNRFSRGEAEDPYFQRCFGHGNPLDRTFQECAENILGPLLAHEEELKE